MIITNETILQYLTTLSETELLLMSDYVQDEMNRRDEEKNKVKAKDILDEIDRKQNRKSQEIAQDILTNTLKQ